MVVRALRPAPRSDLVSGFGGGAVLPARFTPTETIGVPGYATYGGRPTEVESDAALQGRNKFTTYSDLLANVAVIGGSARYFANLVAKAECKFEPADESGRATELAELTEQILDDMDRPLRNVRRRASLFTLYGFSAHEWIARRRPDGLMGFAHIDPRVQKTIVEWPTDLETGELLGVIQESPQDFTLRGIPREKMLYLVDDLFHDSPEGLGVFRHVVEAGDRLRRYEQIEGLGYETDLRGIPIARLPSAALRAQGKDDAWVTAMEAPLKTIAEKHVRTGKLGLVLDSQTYATSDRSPTNVRMWDFELLKGTGAGLPEVHEAIQRIVREIAVVFGTQQLFLGQSGVGTQALSADQSTNLGMVVDQTNDAICEGLRCDILGPLFEMNGWPLELRPFVRADRSQTRDIQAVTAALAELARAGVTLTRDDEVVAEVYTTIGYTPPSPIEIDEDDILPSPSPAEAATGEEEMETDPDEDEDE